MDYGRSLSFIFNDKNWPVKLLILAVCIFLCIPSPIVTGYCLKVIRNVSNGDETLPEFDYLNMFIDGLRVSIGLLLYALPLLIVLAVSFLTTALVGNDYQSLAVGSMLIGVTVVFVAFLLIVVISPALMIHASDDKSWGFMFGFSKIFSIITRNIGPYVMIIVVMFLINFVLAFVGMLIPLIGSAFSSAIGMLASSHLYGQYARQNGVFLSGGYSNNDIYNNNNGNYTY